jgi:hypothetical protein
MSKSARFFRIVKPALRHGDRNDKTNTNTNTRTSGR